MLATEDFVLDDYVFKSSPESCSDHSYSTESMDVTSDEDFLTQLSSDLGIPLLLNPEDDLGMLNSFFDQSPEEILSDIASPPYNMDESFTKDATDLDLTMGQQQFLSNLDCELKIEHESNSSSESTKSVSPVRANNPQFFQDDVKIKSPPLSPNSPQSIVIDASNINDIPKNMIYTQPLPLAPAKQNSLKKMPPKRIPIVPKTPYSLPVTNNKVVLINQPVITNATTSNVVLLENISVTTSSKIPTVNTSPISTVSKVVSQTAIPPVIIDSKCFSLTGTTLDPKAFKRQQRKIKNRESASLSRKKKKDYITSLEEQVKDLTTENERLKAENVQLKEKLAKHETSSSMSINNKNACKYLCIILLIVGVNFNVLRNPFNSKKELDVISRGGPPLDHHSRNLLWTEEETQPLKNETPAFSTLTMCPVNQTETARLVLELERWIGKPMEKSDKATHTPEKPVKTRSRRRKYKSNSPVVSYRYKNKVDKQLNAEPRNELQVFSLSPEQAFSEFFEAINRQDDTFYVVSFTDQHLLLPALQHNKTRRPKMSLIMPSLLQNGTNAQASHLPLMQIDCEVLDTKLLRIKHGIIPQHLRSFGNTTKQEAPAHQENTNSTSDETKYYKKPYKPYFMNKNVLKNSRFFNWT